MIARRPVKLALAQMRVDGGDVGANLARADRRIAEASAAGANVVLLPEALDVGWTHPAARQLAAAIPDGHTCSRLIRAAQAHRVFICAGLTERRNDQIFNAAVLIDPSGGVLIHHRKLNELEIGHDLYAPGDRLSVAHTELGCMGLMICADAFASNQFISRTLGLMGAQIILSPCAWAVRADHDQRKDPYGQLWLDNYAPVARDYGLWIAGASNVGPITAGPWQGRHCIGCSLVVGPDGQQVLMGPYGVDADALLYVDIALPAFCVRHHSSNMSKA